MNRLAYSSHNRIRQAYRARADAAHPLAMVLFIGTLVGLPGCMPAVWNAGDLAEWVRDQAVDRGCERDTIKLEDWYVETPEGNVWRGTCTSGDKVSTEFGINVDKVWTPSGS